MPPGSDPAFQQALDKLMVQVDSDNVLAAAAVFQRHAEKLLDYLSKADGPSSFGPCGGDPVSQETLQAGSFRGKIHEMFRAHWDHQRELQAVADHLFETARRYGHTEDNIAKIMQSGFATW